MTAHPLSNDQRETVRQAQLKARRLIEELARHLEDLEANASELKPDQLDEGRAAVARALAGAQRTLAALEDALSRENQA